MTNTCLGIDIGKTQLKLVLMKDEKILKYATVQMPEGLYKDGQIISIESMGELLRNAMEEHKLRAKDAAIILPSRECYLKNTTMPEMTREQMMYNIPYEFRDFITDEVKDYAFDYVEYGKSEQGTDILAIAASIKVISDMRLAVRKAGLRLKMVTHEILACEALLYRYLRDSCDLSDDKEYVILDVGSSASRLMIFKGHNHQITRTVDLGMDRVEEYIADAYNIDIHLAHTWLLTNHEDCVHSEACQEAFSRISIEIMRALNFYRFSNPDSNIEEIMVCGSNEATEAVKASLRENIDAEIIDASCMLNDFMEAGKETISSVYLQAIGVALSGNINTQDKIINLANAGIEKKHYELAVPALVAILVGAGIFGKFGVADRLIEVSNQQSQTSAVQSQVDAANEYIESVGDLQNQYSHYTYNGFTDDELLCMNRPEVMKLLKEKVFPKAIVSNWSLEGNQLTLPVTGASLADINSLVQELEKEDIVDYCTVSTAVTQSGEGDKRTTDTVTGQITIYLKTVFSDEFEEIVGGTDDEADES